MKNYRVEIDSSAKADFQDLSNWISGVMSPTGGDKYLDAMLGEVKSLSIFADLYTVSRYADIRRYHPKARRMVSHNKKWVYIFHTEGDVVVLDRIRPSKLIKK